MNILFKEFTFFNRRVPFVAILWFALALIAVVSEVLRHSINNYLIFKYVFWHVLHREHLYVPYPEYADVNHYGPLFSLVIAPFAILPDWLGCILWAIANAGLLYYAIRRLKLPPRETYIVIVITAIEMMTSVHSVQFNPMVGAWLVLAYVLVEEEKDIWATLLIAAGFLIKLYGIAGLLFFVFSKHKPRFIVSFIAWLAVLFCLPMLWSSPSYILDTYREWLACLVEKDKLNAAGFAIARYQDVSVMGIVRRITGDASIGNLPFIIPAALMILIPLLRIRQYTAPQFRLSYLAIVLIMVVIFSSSAESATYVIALPGAALWYIIFRRKYKWGSTIMLLLLFMLTILSPTDLMPSYIKNEFIRAYSLKALPCFMIWLWLVAEVMFNDFTGSTQWLYETRGSRHTPVQ